MRGALDGDLEARTQVEHAAGVLRLLGVPAPEAGEIARRALPGAAQGLELRGRAPRRSHMSGRTA